MNRNVAYFLVLVIVAIAAIALTLIHFSDLKLHIAVFDEEVHATLHSLSFQCNDSEPLIKQISKPFRAFVLQTCGNIIERIRRLNVALNSVRKDKLKTHQKTTDWSINSPSELTLLAEWKNDYFQALANFSQLTLIILPWIRNSHINVSKWSSLDDSFNLPIQEYYESTASDLLCSWIETPGQVMFSFDVINNWTCNRNATKAVLPKSVSLLSLNAKAPYKNYYYPSAFPEQFFTELPSVLYSLYIVESGVIADKGDVFIRDAKIVPYACFPDPNLNPPKDVQKFPIYDEVLVITQTYGHSHYHRQAETFPRIAVLVDFLQMNPTIRIHVPENFRPVTELLKMIGINESRIIIGWCRAEIVYLPRATMCCFPNFLETQILSRLFRRYVKTKFPAVKRNKIIVIRRSKERSFHNYTAVESVVRMAALDYNLTYETFRDDPAPPITDIARLFNSAVMVVAPHGAGLSNLVFSEPGTFVIEGVCNRPATCLFFQRTSLVLGHRYHGIAPIENGCHFTDSGLYGPVIIKPSVINETVRTYLDLLASRNFTIGSSAELSMLH